MVVYVDDMGLSATVGRVAARWSHLMADSSVELAEFADRLGLDPSWIQYPNTAKEHFDVTATVRARALRLGAVPIQYGEGGHLTMAKARGEVFDLAGLRARRAQEALVAPVEGGLW